MGIGERINKSMAVKADHDVRVILRCDCFRRTAHEVWQEVANDRFVGVICEIEVCEIIQTGTFLNGWVGLIASERLIAAPDFEAANLMVLAGVPLWVVMHEVYPTNLVGFCNSSILKAEKSLPCPSLNESLNSTD